MLFTISCYLAAASALTGVTGFILYIRARMQANVAKEKRYLRLHYIALTLLLFFLIAALNLYKDPY